MDHEVSSIPYIKFQERWFNVHMLRNKYTCMYDTVMCSAHVLRNRFTNMYNNHALFTYCAIDSPICMTIMCSVHVLRNRLTDMYDIAVLVYEDVPVVPVLELEEVAHQRVSGHATNKVGSGLGGGGDEWR